MDAFRSTPANQGVMLGEHEKVRQLLNEQQGSNNQRLNQVFELLKNLNDRLTDSSSGKFPSSVTYQPGSYS